MIIMSRSGDVIRTRRIARWWTHIVSKALSLFSVLLIISTVLFPVASLQAAPAQPGDYVRYFPETGHNLSGQVNAFYARHGGQAIFGLPITEVITDGEVRVQYFERARFELRPKGIALTLIGRAVSAKRSDPAFACLAESTAPHRTYYPQSSHTLGGAFDWFWQSHGGLAIFGYPISEEFVEQGVLVQYFERARFEYRPEHVGAEVQISMLGRAYAQRRGVTERLLAPVPPMVQLGIASIVIPASAQHNVALATQKFDGVEVAPGGELSFLQTIGEVSARKGYKSGQAIVNGEIRSSTGGGICYLSTALYRAAFLAGLPIIERRPHSIALASLSDVPGFDSAIDTSGLDLRWQNDTPHTILVMAHLNNGRLTVALWGQGDGRTTTMHGSSVKTAPNTQVATISRVVVAANGVVLRNEAVQSRYVVMNTTTRTKNQTSTR
jgi:hypothetical protein